MRALLAGLVLAEVEVLDQRLVIHRLGEQEALAETAPQLAEGVDLLGLLDSLGHDVEVQAVPERDDRAREARLIVLGREERAVHLEDVDREAAQVRERGIAGPEV